MGNKDIKVYYYWIKDKTKNDENYTYDILANTDDFSPYDILQMRFDTDGEFTQQFIEIKGRNINYTDKEDSILEDYKVKKLQKITRCTGIPTYYCAIYFLDNKLLLWKINPEKEYEIDRMEMNKSYCGDNRKVMKDVVHFPYKEANKYNIPQYIMDLVK